MKKKIFLSLFALMFSLLFFTVNASAASPDVRSYDYAENNYRLLSSNNYWNNGFFYYYEETGTDLRPYVSDFTPKFSINIIGYDTVHVIFKHPTEIIYDLDDSYGDYLYTSLNLFSYGNFLNNSSYNYFTYQGYYGDSNHRNGTNVQPFFLFYNGYSYTPNSIAKYDAYYYYYATFTLPTFPVKRNFQMGISFTTNYLRYEGRSGYDYCYWQLGNTNIVLSDDFYLN